jgi:hypothetical protein
VIGTHAHVRVDISMRLPEHDGSLVIRQISAFVAG